MPLVFMSAHRCELISCRGSVVNIGTHRGRGIKEMQHDGTARALAKKYKLTHIERDAGEKCVCVLLTDFYDRLLGYIFDAI
jgi:hypothetical protein